MSSYVKIERQLQFLSEQVLLSVRFQAQRKETQKMYFTNANTINEKV